MKENKTPIINKIEIDENTAEPTIVEVPVDQLPAESQESSKETAKPNEDLHLSAKSIGKQMVMKQVLGLNPNNNSTNKRQKLFKNIMTITFLVVVLAVLAITFYNDFLSPEAQQNPPNWQEIQATLSQNWFYVIFALLSLLMCFLSKGFKLSVMCKKMTGKWRIKACMETAIVGHYYNYVTPLAVGGQPFEIYHLSRHGVHGGVASSMPIAAFFMYQFAFVVLGIFSLIIFTPGANLLQFPDSLMYSTMAAIARPMAIVGLTTCLLMPLIVVIFCILPKACAKLVYFVMYLGGKMKLIKNVKLTTYKTLKTVIGNAKCIKKMGTSPLIFFVTFLISIVEVLALCSIAYFTLRFFGFDNPNAWSIMEWAQIVIVCIVLYAAVSFIPTPGNSGAADASFYSLFKVGLVSVAGLSFPAMLLWRILSFYSFIIIGFAFTTLKRKSDRKKEQMGVPLYKE